MNIGGRISVSGIEITLPKGKGKRRLELQNTY
jgi:hypothetical protein